MKTGDTEIVAAIRTMLAERIGKHRYELWFGASTRLDVEAGVLRVRVPDKFFLDWLRSNFRHDLECCASEALNQHSDNGDSSAKLGFTATDHIALGFTADQQPKCKVEFRIDPSLAAGNQPSSKADSKKAGSLTRAPAAAPTPNSPPSAARPAPSRRPFARLATFVVGDCNRLAYTSAGMVTDHLGGVSPLLLHGPTAIGKTHLLEGVFSAAKSKHRGGTIYLSAEQFTTYYLAALHGGGMPAFRGKYRCVHCLIIDDLQFFCGKKSTIGELLHTIDTLTREGRQLVFAADRSPAELSGLGPELLTRLQGGLVCEMGPPDAGVRLGIVRRLASELGVKIPKPVRQYVADHLTSHARELSGAVNRLKATSLALDAPITLAMAEDALSEMIRQSGPAVRLQDIEQAVCHVLGLNGDALQSHSKSKSVSRPRMLAMWLARKHTRVALSEIGRFFGHRSHSTVISAQKKVNAWMADGRPLELVERRWTADEAIRKVEEQLRVG